MNAPLLGKLFGTDGRWSAACTVVLDADANVQITGTDAIIQGGLKSFAPRLITGRVYADAVRFMPEQGALLLVQKVVIRQSTGDDTLRQTLLVVDAAHVAAVEFAELGALELLGVPPPK
jgi:hypothetical protein